MSPGASPGLIDLDVAARFASRFASGGPLEGSYLLEDLEGHLDRLVAEAEPLVERETGFVVGRPATARVMSRSEWATSNITSMSTLMAPLFEKVEKKIDETPGSGIVRMAYRPLLGFQMGAILGFLSHRVLGQYDVLMPASDEVWFVGTNLVVMERRFGFVPRDFRLWVALHEVTHRNQFQGNPWLREHFLSLIRDLFDSLELDPRSFMERLVEIVRRPDSDSPLAILGPEQKEKFERLQAFMSVIEGHGNFVMDRVGEDLIPTQPRMKRTLQGRAQMSGPLGRLLRKLLGLDIKRLQYEEGQKFFNHVFEGGGHEAVRAAFDPNQLPTLQEIRAPSNWLDRMKLRTP